MAKDKGKSFQTKGELISVLNQLKSESEGKGRAEFAQGIGQLIQDLNDGKRDHTEVSIKGRIRLKKYNGVRLPESVPVEVQEFITDV
jgi:hypothetical protein